LTAVRRIGIRAKVLSAISNKSKNILWDAVRVGTGITATDGYGSAPITMYDIVDAVMDNTSAWGVFTQAASVYYSVGKLNVGTIAQSNVTVFRDSNLNVVYKSLPVAANFYEIKIVGASTKKTSFSLGSYDYKLGIASGGCVIKGAGSGATQGM